MAIGIISSIEKTVASGTIVVPEDCVLIVAVVDGSAEPPKIAGVSMGVIGQVEATSIIPAISIHQYRAPEIATLAYTFVGTTCEFIFVEDGDSYRPGTILGYNAGGVFEGNLPSADGDLVLAILHGSIGPTALECDEVAMTYLKTSTLIKIGYLLAGTALIACLASDTGVSEGYYADGGQTWAEGSYTPGHFEYHNVWYEGHWESMLNWFPAYWEIVDGKRVFIPAHWESRTYWVEGEWRYESVWVQPITIPGHWDDNPDVWVEAGSSQCSAIFCSISPTAGGAFISRPIMFT